MFLRNNLSCRWESLIYDHLLAASSSPTTCLLQTYIMGHLGRTCDEISAAINNSDSQTPVLPLSGGMDAGAAFELSHQISSVVTVSSHVEGFVTYCRFDNSESS